jgi:hypothetical protein
MSKRMTIVFDNEELYDALHKEAMRCVGPPKI